MTTYTDRIRHYVEITHGEHHLEGIGEDEWIEKDLGVRQSTLITSFDGAEAEQVFRNADHAGEMVSMLYEVLSEAKVIEDDARADWKELSPSFPRDKQEAAALLDLTIAYRERLEGMIRPLLNKLIQ